MSAFADIGSIAPQQIWEGVVGRPVHGQRVTFSHIELEPNSVVPEHSHESEQIGILVRGSLTFRVGEEMQTLGPGATWSIPPNVPHEVHTGPGGAVLVEVFAPGRDDWHALERREPAPPLWP